MRRCQSLARAQVTSGGYLKGGGSPLSFSAVHLAETHRGALVGRYSHRTALQPARWITDTQAQKYLDEPSKPGMHRCCADVRPMGVRDWWALRDSNPPPLPCKRRPAQSPDLGKQPETAFPSGETSSQHLTSFPIVSQPLAAQTRPKNENRSHSSVARTSPIQCPRKGRRGAT